MNWDKYRKEVLGINDSDEEYDMMGRIKVFLNDRYGRYGSLPVMTASSIKIERRPIPGAHIETTVEIDMDLNELPKTFNYYNIKKVIYHDPATIILWRDGSKTVVKCAKGETYDPEKGFAMACIKYNMGNDNQFHKIFKKYMPKEEK